MGRNHLSGEYPPSQAFAPLRIDPLENDGAHPKKAPAVRERDRRREQFTRRIDEVDPLVCSR